MLFAATLGVSTHVNAAPPDLTTGGVPSDTANINLGPTGMEGWMYNAGSAKLGETVDARQIRVTKVDVGSPAAGVLAVGDVILGADGTGAEPTAFSFDARKTLAYAINHAEGRNPAVLKLIRWRSGVTTTVSITLEFLGGSYTVTAPFNCPKSTAILEKGVNYIMSSEPGSGYGGFGANVLMAVNDSNNPANAARQTRAQTEARALNLTPTQIADMTSGNLNRAVGKPWSTGPQLITQAEYYLQTNDSTVLPSIRARAIQIANAQSMFGTMGHHYSLPGPNGEINGPYGIGYGPVNNAGMPCFIGLILANKCGLTDAPIVAGIDRAAKYFQYYADLGCVPYGENKETGSITNNGKAGLAAISLGMLNGYESQTKYFTKLSVYGADERDSGHTGPYFNHLWTPIATNLGGQNALVRYFNQTSWLYDLARRWNGAFVYQPYYQNGGIEVYGSDHRASWTALLTYAAPMAKLHITGKNANPALALSSSDMADINHALGYNPATRTTAQLLQDLAHPLPQLHWLAGAELGRRTSDHASILPTLYNMANNATTYSERHGAIFALWSIKNDSSAPTLAALLSSPDSKVRYMAAGAMSQLSMAVKTTHVTTIVNALISTDRPMLPLDPANPMHVDKQAFAQLLFDSVQGVWGGNRVIGANRALFYPAFKIIATAPMGGTRDTAFSVAPFLTKADVEALAAAIVEVGANAPPAEITNPNRLGALTALQINGFAEGVPASMRYFGFTTRDYDKASALGVLEAYAGSGLTVQPDAEVLEFCELLRSNSDTFDTEVQEIINAIAADQLPKTLTSFKKIDWIFADKPSLTMPATNTVLRVHSSDLANGAAYYTWRKVNGAGNVSFLPNGTSSAKNTTVVFDGTPGVYTFEVAMADDRKLTEAYGRVTVTLNDSSGTLPPNSSPIANPQSIVVGQGTPTQVVLTGSDAQGQALNYSVKTDPNHGSLSGTPPHLVYTANLAYTGADSIVFEVMDTEGLKSTATVNITVGAVNNVGLAIYEPFKYPSGFFNGASSVNEIGLLGAWTAGFDVRTIGGSLNYGSLRIDGGSLGNMTTTNGYGGHRAINPAALAGNGLLADGATLWFSAELGYPGGNYQQSIYLALANSRFNASGNSHYINNESPQLGVGVGVAVNGGEVRAAKFGDASQGSGTASHTYGGWSAASGSMGSYSHRLVVGKLTWGATSDTIEIYLPWENLTLPATPSSILSVNVNQSTFDTLTFSRNGVPIIDEIRFGSTYQSVIQGTTPMSEDNTAPTPNPMIFAVAPKANSLSSITMTATAAHDLMEVEYYFTCTAGGGDDSGWQSSRSYTDSGLTPGVAYSYTVKARDKNPGLNETAPSTAASAIIPLLATVPNVVGIQQASAEGLLSLANLTVGSITSASSYSLTIPQGHVRSQTPTSGTAAYGSPVNLEISIGQDPALPTLAALAITDDKNGGPVVINTPMIYTLTFSEDINAATLNASDFVNIGDSPITIGTISEISPGVVTVGVTPTVKGILRFAVASGASILDAQGHAFNSTYATIDDTVVTVQLPSVTVPNVVGMAQSSAGSAITNANLLIGTVNSIYSQTVAIGNVISQNPVAGSSIPGQHAVNIVISLGPPPDTVSPVVVSTSPADSGYNVETNAPLVITFSEQVVIGAGNVTIRNLNDGSDMIIPLSDPAQALTYNNILTITPAASLLAGKSYAVRISMGAVLDASGNSFQGIQNDFTWNFSTSLNPLASVLYTENFESPNVANYVQGTTPPTWVKASQGFNASYHGLIDKAGGAFSVPEPNKQAYAFRYGNSGITTAEAVIGTIAAGTTYEVSFDVIRDGTSSGTGYAVKMLAFPAGAVRNDCRSDGTGIVLASATGNASSDGFLKKVTFQATVNAGSSAIGRDFSLRFIGAGSSAIVDNVRVRTISPSTPDQVAPAVALLTPLDNSANVSLTNNLRIVFGENIAIGAGNITIKDLTTGAKTVINIINGSQILVNGTTLEINPTSDFNTNTFYSVRIDAGAIIDLAGNGFAGINNDVSWTFNTGETTDSEAPAILAVSPIDGATGVSYRSNLSLTFNENVVVNTGNITLKNLTDATQTVINVSDFSQVVATASTVTINPTSYLGEGKNYAIHIDAGAILDLSGNAHAGISDDVTWNFTTSGNNPPDLLSLSPLDEVVNVDIASNLSVTFDEPIAAGTGNITIRNVITNSNLVINVNDAAQVSISGAVLTINPSANLGEATNYAVLIGNGAIQDLTGNFFGGITSDATWNFVTGISSVGLAFFDDFEVSSGSPNVDAAGSVGNTSKKTGPKWLRTSAAFGASNHGIVDESSLQFTDPVGQQAYAFRYTNSGLTTAQGQIGTLVAGNSYRVAFNVVGDGFSNGGSYSIGLVSFAPGASRNEFTSVGQGTSRVLATRSSSYSGSAYRVVLFEYISDGIVDAAVQGHDVAIRLVGASASAIVDNVQVTINDVRPPTLASANIVDNQGGSPSEMNTPVNYTLTFSEDIAAASVTIDDFGNAGTSSVVVNSATETSPGVFLVSVTPSSVGSLRLRINAGALVTDLSGNPLNSATAILDDTTISVIPVNSVPISNSQNVTTNEDTALPITLIATDADNNLLTYTVLTQPANGMLTGIAPNLTYTPLANFNGMESFTFRANDGLANSNTATVTINVNSVNDAPIAVAQSVNTNEDSSLPITLTGTDIESSALTFTVVTPPANGSLSGNSPNFTYTPSLNFNGVDSFTFVANDGMMNSAVNIVSISVAPINDAPVALALSISTTEDNALPITLTATDVENSALTYTVLSQPTKGTINGVAPNVIYTPDSNYNGVDAFTFMVNDGTLSSTTATVSITVTSINDAPVFASNPTVLAAGSENAAYTGQTLAGLASDVDAGDTLTYAKISGPVWLSVASDGSLSGTPPFGSAGINAFVVSTTDAASATANTTLEINIARTFFTWDSNGVTAGQTNGAGAWLGANQWWNGTSNQNWQSGASAIFGGQNTAGGSVTLAGPTTLGAITFNQYTGSYALGTAGNTITLNGGISKQTASGIASIVSPLILSSTQTWSNHSVNALSTSSTLNTNGNLLIINGSGIVNFATSSATIISGSGGVTMHGPGRLTLGANQQPVHSYTGTTTLNGGVTMIANNNLGSGNLTLNGGVLETYWSSNFIRALGGGAGQVQMIGGSSGFALNGNTSSSVILGNNAANEAVWGSAHFNPSMLVLQSQFSQVNSTLNFQNRIDLNGSDRTIQVSGGTTGAASATISGVIRNSTGTAGLIKLGTGRLNLNGANSYNGGTTLQEGSLQLGNATGLGSTSNQLTVNGGLLNTNNVNITIGNLNGSGGTIANNGNAVSTLTIGSGNGNGGIFQGVIANRTTGTSGAINLTKIGTGTITLGGANTYTGVTTLSAGKLCINGSLSNTNAALNVASAATLGGNGTIGRNVTISSGGGLEFDLSTTAASHDRLDISSGRSFAFSGASVLTITSSSGAEPGIYTLVSGGNSITGAAPATLNLPVGWAATVSISGNSLLLNVTSAGSAQMRMASRSSSSGSTKTAEVSAITSSGATFINGENSAIETSLPTIQSSLPLPWSSIDIGNGMLTGSATHHAGTFTQQGSGVIGNEADKLRFTYQALTGDGEITARVSGREMVGKGGRIGLMIRDSIAANSKQIFMGLTHSDLNFWSHRADTGATTVHESSKDTVPSSWIRLVRSGNTITAYKSQDGKKWTAFASARDTSFASTCYIGLAVSSGRDNSLTGGQFNNVSVTP